MITPGLSQYEVVLNNKYFLRELIKDISLEDSLSDIAVRGTIQLVVADDTPFAAPGQMIRISGVPFGGSKMVFLLHPAVVWEVESETQEQKQQTITAYDPTIYLARSEDEYLLLAGQTASQRLRKYASDWNISLDTLTDTEVQLSKAVRRAQPIYNMILADLRETVAKGGEMFFLRMTPGGLTLDRLGSNEKVWVLEIGQNLKRINRAQTLDSAITQVKVLGAAAEGVLSPVLALESEKTELGTLQKIIQDAKITTSESAKQAAKEMLADIQTPITVEAIDINTVRAGDKITLNDTNLFVISVRHELGSPGRMLLELGSAKYIRRQFYDELH